MYLNILLFSFFISVLSMNASSAAHGGTSTLEDRIDTVASGSSVVMPSVIIRHYTETGIQGDYIAKFVSTEEQLLEEVGKIVGPEGLEAYQLIYSGLSGFGTFEAFKALKERGPVFLWPKAMLLKA